MMMRLHDPRIARQRIRGGELVLDLAQAGNRAIATDVHEGVADFSDFFRGKHLWNREVTVAVELGKLFCRHNWILRCRHITPSGEEKTFSPPRRGGRRG